MTKILGLDLGSGSIGWGVINYVDDPEKLCVLGCGIRVVSIDSTALANFNTGQQITINSNRTKRRTARKTYDRYVLRRNRLLDFFKQNGVVISNQMMTLNRDELWRLRARAATERITLEELGRVLYLLNQKRGYKASKADLDPENKEQKPNIANIRSNYGKIKESESTIGQWISAGIDGNPEFRVKNIIFPRAAYIEEFDKIIETQRRFHPEFLTDENIKILRNKIIFYQRPLKSCKHLVSPCEFQQFETETSDGRKIMVGPKVTHRSNPLFQLFRIWQSVNNITLRNRRKESRELDIEEKERLVHYLLNSDKLTATEIKKLIFGKKAQNVWFVDKFVEKGIPEDKTRMVIKSALGNKYGHLLKFDLEFSTYVDRNTGEILPIVDPKIVDSPYYRLWHCLYSISDKTDLKATLRRQFGIEDDDVLEALSNIDLVKYGYANLSIKAIRRVLPFLMKGEVYSQACESAGFRHSDYLTSEENATRTLDRYLKPLKKGELRQPIVEKILNQMVNLVNAIVDKYGPMDEIVVELARVLQMSREQRYKASKAISKNEKENSRIANRIKKYDLFPTRSRIIKYKLWEESGKCCLYCGSPVGIKEFLSGYDVEVEHIIPRSMRFDDSFSNKACSCRKCNHDKGNMTAKDYMMSLGEDRFNDYVARINELKDKKNKDKKISPAKFDNLMRGSDNLQDDFILRQLRETQYISRKAMEMLRKICRNVRATSGSVTGYLRHVWGWDQILHDLNLESRRADGETEIVVSTHLDSTKEKERIKDWSKRLDHRHHAIDALTIACTPQSFIQRLNNLSALSGENMKDFHKLTDDQRKKHNLLERYSLSLPHFTTSQIKDAVSGIFVSFKPITRVATSGKRYVRQGGKRVVAQSGVIVPRGELHDEYIYGRINVPDNKGVFRKKFVKKYPIGKFESEKDANRIVDKAIRELVIARLREYGGNAKEAFAHPLYSDKDKTKEIKSVRCFPSKNDKRIPVRYDEDGREIGFARPDNNHHAVIYEDANGKLHEHVATFFHCVERRKHGITPIISDTDKMWDDVMNREEEFAASFLEKLPQQGWKAKLTLQRNEMFILGMEEGDFRIAVETGDRASLAEHLYKVQRLSSNKYYFAKHTETNIANDKNVNKPGKRFYLIRFKSFFRSNPHKVRISNLGEIMVLC